MSTRYDGPIYAITLNVETDKGIKRVDYMVSASSAEDAIKKAGQGQLTRCELMHYDAIVVD